MKRIQLFLATLLMGMVVLMLTACGGGGSDAGGGGSEPPPPPPPPASCDDAAVSNDIPFQYALTPGYLAIQTPGGVLKTLIGPWGAHTQPHTGHAEGDAKANWSGLFATRYDELTELAGDGDGICQKGEVCGLPASAIDARIPQYVAPDDNLKIWSARVEGIVTAGDTYGSVLQWRIESSLCNYHYAFGHVGKVAGDLRNKMVAAGYVDPWTIAGITDNLITGDAIFLNNGESIGVPQIIAKEIAGHAGYYMGGGAFLQSPWAQIEFVGHRVYIEPFYAWLPIALQDQLRSILYADAFNPDSFRYDHPFLRDQDWLWRAEVTLWTAPYSDYNDFSSIFARLGGWFENNPGGCTAGSALCDETFSIFPIVKSSPLYDPGRYDSVAVSYLVSKQRPTVAPYIYKWGEVVEPADPNGLSGSMIIKWRVENATTVLNYQAISYYLNPAAKLLKIRWGSIVADRAAAVAPAVPTDTDNCDGTTLTCLNNDGWWR